MKADDPWSKTPSALTDILTNLAVLKWFFYSWIIIACIDCLSSMLFLC